jgi:hypothetical protein
MEFHSESQYEVCSKVDGRGMGVDAVVAEDGGVPTLGRLTTNSRRYGLQKALNPFPKSADIPRSFATTASTHISRTCKPFIRPSCTVNRIHGVFGSIFFNLGAASMSKPSTASPQTWNPNSSSRKARMSLRSSGGSSMIRVRLGTVEPYAAGIQVGFLITPNMRINKILSRAPHTLIWSIPQSRPQRRSASDSQVRLRAKSPTAASGHLLRQLHY